MRIGENKLERQFRARQIFGNNVVKYSHLSFKSTTFFVGVKKVHCPNNLYCPYGERNPPRNDASIIIVPVEKKLGK